MSDTDKKPEKDAEKSYTQELFDSIRKLGGGGNPKAIKQLIDQDKKDKD